MMDSFDYIQCEDFWEPTEEFCYDPDQPTINEELERQAYVESLIKAEQEFTI